jgi:hypothetical protein
MGIMKRKVKIEVQKKGPERKPKTEPETKHPKHGQPAIMENILELTEKALPKQDNANRRVRIRRRTSR